MATNSNQPATRLTITALVSRSRWLSRLASHATGAMRIELDARRALVLRTIVRQSRGAL